MVTDLANGRCGPFNDVGAVVYSLRKVLWTVPGFTVAAYRDRRRGCTADRGQGPVRGTTPAVPDRGGQALRGGPMPRGQAHEAQ